MASNAVIIFIHAFSSYIKFIAMFANNYLDMYITINGFTH